VDHPEGTNLEGRQAWSREETLPHLGLRSSTGISRRDLPDNIRAHIVTSRFFIAPTVGVKLTVSV